MKNTIEVRLEQFFVVVGWHWFPFYDFCAHGKHDGVDYRSPFRCSHSQLLIIKEHNEIASWTPFEFAHTNTTGLPLDLVLGVWREGLMILELSLYH